jgi:Lon protease-like protein
LPENSTSCPRRTQSTVAPQAFSLLNSPLAVATSKYLANRIEAQGANDKKEEIHQAFLLAYQRPPEKEETRACLQFLETRSLAELARALLNANEFIYVD